jgi:P-type Mg2+ transporter
MFSMAGASLFLNFLPLLPKQVLLTNLLSDLPEMTIASDHVDLELTKKPLRWNTRFIRKFMLLFGLISSLFDYATFGVLLWLNASEVEFRTGWFIESVLSATAIVLVIRTFKPFYQSLPSPYLLSCALFVMVLTLFVPFLPFSNYLGFTTLSLKFYVIMALLILLYIMTVEFAKKVLLRKWLPDLVLTTKRD